MSELIITSDGSHTLFVPELNEHYHSIHGAVQESSLVYVGNGLGFSESDPVNIFEVGFGTGLNALLSLVYSQKYNRTVNYTSVEKHPLGISVINTLNHWKYGGDNGKALFDKIHKSSWEIFNEIEPTFNLRKICSDFSQNRVEGKYNLIFFDAFGPDKQPEIWSSSVFKNIGDITEQGGIFVTYSAKGEVKRLLKANGFRITMLPGPPGKREMIRAIKE